MAEKDHSMSIPAVMRALQQTSLNGPQDLRMITGVQVPVPGAGEVLIRVTAAGVNFADISRAYGKFRGGPQPPYLAGFEAAGEVVGVGDGVTRVAVGARVVGVGYGAFAEYMVLPVASVVPVPVGWDDEQALGLVVNWPTAVAALNLLGHLARGETVLIHAAAGGTGQAAVKIAKHYGATVIAAASRGKHETVRALGADHVLDSRSSNIAAEVLRLTGGAGADLVLESVGAATFDASLSAAKRVTGRVVVYGLAGGEATLTNWDLVYKHQVHIIGFNIGVLIQSAPQMFGEIMGELFALIAAGVLSPCQPTLYKLADGPKALAALETRASVGKLALQPLGEPENPVTGRACGARVALDVSARDRDTFCQGGAGEHFPACFEQDGHHDDHADDQGRHHSRHALPRCLAKAGRHDQR
jgi:NADPH:quinone reductase